MHQKSCHKKVLSINESEKYNEEFPVQQTDNFIDHDNFDSDDDEDEITKKYSCDQCEYSSDVKGNITKHIKNIHKKDISKLLKRKRESDSIPSSKKTKEGSFSCDECEFKTNTKQELKTLHTWASASPQLNIELSLYMLNLICIPRVLELLYCKKDLKMKKKLKKFEKS